MTQYFALSLKHFILECFLLIGNDIMDTFERLLFHAKERLVELIVFDIDKHEFTAEVKLEESLILLPNEFDRKASLVKFCMHDGLASKNF